MELSVVTLSFSQFLAAIEHLRLLAVQESKESEESSSTCPSPPRPECRFGGEEESGPMAASSRVFLLSFRKERTAALEGGKKGHWPGCVTAVTTFSLVFFFLSVGSNRRCERKKETRKR